jgi:multidrug efflux pump subunit AcrA (membrane-fusion protein)
MMLRVLSWGCAVLALALAGWGGYLWLAPAPPPRPVFVVEAPERDLGDCPVGETLVTFRVTNQSDLPGRIIGLEEG